MKPATPHEIQPGSPVDQAAEQLFAAVRHYSDMVKRFNRAGSFGVMWLKNGNELICYTQSARYANQIVNMTFDAARDQLDFAAASESDEQEERITTRYRELEDEARARWETSRHCGENI